MRFQRRGVLCVSVHDGPWRPTPSHRAARSRDDPRSAVEILHPIAANGYQNLAVNVVECRDPNPVVRYVIGEQGSAVPHDHHKQGDHEG